MLDQIRRAGRGHLLGDRRFGDLSLTPFGRLRTKNARLKRIEAGLTLDRQILDPAGCGSKKALKAVKRRERGGAR
ncbi:hypothetical protein LPB72_10785 [Hydrogenophaga crassostreae]|uniref:Uncharacterized protein n=1 Tax=Hydrogenophaga crassostreae TaxID=1763535 RepID=A0A167HVG7_9BURK|nr:hypothetical protein LPB072_12160 [Hydrogenophaga crassostreae]OAD41790.1 hypothetical protein LPB72_10785 [Hydrogenophaga crassostreae]